MPTSSPVYLCQPLWATSLPCLLPCSDYPAPRRPRHDACSNKPQCCTHLLIQVFAIRPHPLAEIEASLAGSRPINEIVSAEEAGGGRRHPAGAVCMRVRQALAAPPGIARQGASRSSLETEGYSPGGSVVGSIHPFTLCLNRSPHSCPSRCLLCQSCTAVLGAPRTASSPVPPSDLCQQPGTPTPACTVSCTPTQPDLYMPTTCLPHLYFTSSSMKEGSVSRISLCSVTSVLRAVCEGKHQADGWGAHGSGGRAHVRACSAVPSQLQTYKCTAPANPLLGAACHPAQPAIHTRHG